MGQNYLHKCILKTWLSPFNNVRLLSTAVMFAELSAVIILVGKANGWRGDLWPD